MRRRAKFYPYYVASGTRDDYGEVIWTYTYGDDIFGQISKMSKADIVDSGLDVDKITHVIITKDDIYKGDKVGDYIIDDTFTEHNMNVGYLYECE